MASLIVALNNFVDGLLALEVPGLGIPMYALICGLWILHAVGSFIFGMIFNWNNWKE